MIDRALKRRQGEARLFEAKARYLRDLARIQEAREVVAGAITAGLESPALRRLERALRRIICGLLGSRGEAAQVDASTRSLRSRWSRHALRATCRSGRPA